MTDQFQEIIDLYMCDFKKGLAYVVTQAVLIICVVGLKGGKHRFQNINIHNIRATHWYMCMFMS